MSKSLKTVAVFCRDVPGVLARIVGFISAKSTNIASLAVTSFETREHGDGDDFRMCIPIAVEATPGEVDVFRNNMQRIIDVEAAIDLTQHPEVLVLYLVMARVYVIDPHAQERVRTSAKKYGAMVLEDGNYAHYVTAIFLGEAATADAFADIMGANKRRTIVRGGPFVIS